MPKINDFSNSRFLKQEDLPADEDGNRAAVVTLRKFVRMNVGTDEDPEMKWCVKFDEFPKPMRVNATNGKLLGRIFNTDNTDDMEGQRVIVWADPNVTMKGEMTGGLRFKAIPKKKTAAAPAPTTPVREPGEDEGEEAYA